MFWAVNFKGEGPPKLLTQLKEEEEEEEMIAAKHHTCDTPVSGRSITSHTCCN